MSLRVRVGLLVLAAVATYWNALPAPFVLDDQTAILTNRSIESLTLPGPLVTPSETPVARRPLVNLSFAVNYALDGHNPRWYRTGNLLIHIFAALALFGCVRRTLLLPVLRATFERAATSIAWVCALIWLLHPLNSEIVDYVTQRSSGLFGLFYLLTLYCAIRATAERHAGRWAVSAIACCIAGMLCKESMVTAPIIVVLYDRMFQFDSWRTLLSRRAKLYGGLAVSWLVLAIAIGSADRTSAGFGAVAASLGNEISPWQYVLNQARLIPRYLYLTVWPRMLVVDYGNTGTVPLSAAIVPGTLIVIAALLSAVGLFRWRTVAFPAAWFFITLAPASSIVPIATEVGAERRMYLPLAGLIVFVVTGTWWLARRHDRLRAPLRVACAVVVVGLALGTVVRNRDYVDPVRLAETVVERWPSGRAHVQLGTLYDARGDRDAAIREYREALAVYPPAEFVLGVALVEQKHFDEGLAHLRAFVNRTPRHDAVVGARDLIGRVLTDRNDFEGASREFELMLAKNASNARAMVLLAEVRLRQHRTSEAIDLFERARRVSAAVGQDAFVMKRYGDALARSNRLVEAERVFAAAAAAHPRDASLQKLWGRSLAAQGRFAAAAERFRHARVLAPDDPEARELDQAIRQRVGVVRR